MSSHKRTAPHLQCLRLADNSHCDEELNIDILIDADFCWHFVSGSVIRGPGSGPIVLSTRFGYVLFGPVGIPVPEQGDSTVNLTETHVLKISNSVTEEEDSLVREVKHFWDLGPVHMEVGDPR